MSRERLQALGYKLHADADGYRVDHLDRFVGGAGVKLPREKPLHWRHARANFRDNLEHARQMAESDYLARAKAGQP